MATFSVVKGTNHKPVSSDVLVETLSSISGLDGELFVGYPIVGGSDGKFTIDAAWVSPTAGVIIFDLIEGSDATGFEDRQDDAANKLEAKLKVQRELVERRKLKIELNTLSFVASDTHSDIGDHDGYIVASPSTLEDVLDGYSWQSPSSDVYRATLSTLQNISSIRKTRGRRNVKADDSRGAILKRLEDSIATLDNRQGKAVIETVHGVQRIRGLAGSGKTIVLALKAAYLHAQQPDWKIAVTFNTRSLKGQLERLINTFCIEQTGQEPDWEYIQIIHAWGASGGGNRQGIYHQFCQAVDAPYYDFRSARARSQNDPFRWACAQAIAEAKGKASLYDAILVDEAQDLPIEFLQICYQILGTEKRLVYAYDELQNLNGSSVPSPEEIFGVSPDGKPLVTFSDSTESERRQDIILETCYRNSRPVLVTAHALGFGIYREPPHPRSLGLVQMFDDAELWKDIGYEVKTGQLSDGAEVVLSRKQDASPAFLEEHSSPDELIQFLCFDSIEQQAEWVATQICKNLDEDELRHDDIVVINPNPLTTRKAVGGIRSLLLDNDINSHIAGVDTVPDVFFKKDNESITFTGIYRAKGNEAGMVYVINAQDCAGSYGNLATRRNRLFTAITRSKSWVRVLGVGEEMDSLISEYESLKQNNFQLNFKYPTAAERENMNIVHRDMSAAEKKRVDSTQQALGELLSDLDKGTVHLQDIDEDLLEKLKQYLKPDDQ